MKKQTLTDIVDTIEMFLPGSAWTKTYGESRFLSPCYYLCDTIALATLSAWMADEQIEKGLAAYLAIKIVTNSFILFDRRFRTQNGPNPKYDVPLPTSPSSRPSQRYGG